MDSKKPSSGMLRHLRQKMLPRFRRGRANKLPVELDPNLDYRMSSSVPDVRDMKQPFVRSPSRSQPLQPDFPVYRSPFSMLVKPPGGATESGSGLKSTLPGQVTRRSEHRLSAPLDCTDWVSSQVFFQGLGEDKTTSSRSNQRIPASMEPEEQVQPERMSPNPDPPPQETSQDAPQVQTPRGGGKRLSLPSLFILMYKKMALSYLNETMCVTVKANLLEPASLFCWRMSGVFTQDKRQQMLPWQKMSELKFWDFHKLN